VNASNAQSFPPGTRFFNLDGMLYAQTQGDNWYTVNSTGSLERVDPVDAPSYPTHTFLGDRIEEPEFLAALDSSALVQESRQFA
jgi:hypothetical protein